MRLPHLRLSRRRVIVLLLVGVATGAYFAWFRPKPRENPTLAEVPLRERMKGLESKDAVERKRTLYTLAAFGPKAKGALPELLKLLLNDPMGDWRDVAVAIGRVGEAAIPELQKLLDEKPPEKQEQQSAWFDGRKRSATALGYAGPGAVPHLRALLAKTKPASDSREFELDKVARESLTRIAAEHPQTIPELAVELGEPNLWDGAGGELSAAAKRSPEVVRIWLSVLDQPDPAAQLLATRVLVRTDVLDPRMIPSLTKEISIWNGSLDNNAQRLLALHRSGHNIVPAVAARWRELRGRDDQTLRENRRACVAVLVEVGPDADALIPEFRERLRTETDEWDAAAFLSAAEKRRTQRAALPAVGGNLAVATLPPSSLPTLVERLCDPSANERERGHGYNHAAASAISNNYAEARPHLLAVLRAGPAPRRNAVLGYLARHYAGNYQHSRPVSEGGVGWTPVPDDLLRAVTELLALPETREKAIRLLGEIGAPARSAVPDLLAALDGPHLREVLSAIGQIGSVDPAHGARFAQVRTAFAAHPKRAEIVEQLKAESRKTSGEEFAPLVVLLLLHESAEETVGVLRERQKAWASGPRPVGDRERTERFIESLAALDPVLFAQLLDGGVSFSCPPVHAFHPGPEGRRFLPALLKMLNQRRGVEIVTEPLAALCRDDTPKEVGEALFRLLEKPGLDGWERVVVLRALARVAPTAGGRTIPAALRESKELRTRRFAAAAALRGNPKDADARKVVLDWAGTALPEDANNGPAFDRAPVAALAPLAPDDAEALAALVKFLEKLQLSTPLYLVRPETRVDAEFTLGVILKSEKAGVEAIVSRFLLSKDDGLAVVLRRLAAEGKVSLPDVFARVRPAVAAFRGVAITTDQQQREKKQAFTALRSVATDETAGDLLDLAAALWESSHESWLEWTEEPHDQQLRRALYPSRELAAHPLLRRWLVEPSGPRADLAYYALSVTHPGDPDVWRVTARRAIDSETAARWTTERVIRRAGAKGIPVIRVQWDLFGDVNIPRERLITLLGDLPPAHTDALLVDPDARVRVAAVRSVTERRRFDWPDPPPQEVEEAHTAVARVLGRVLARDDNDDVRAAAWRGINSLAYRGARPARLLEALAPEERAAWLAQARSMWRQLLARPDDIGPYFRPDLEAWTESLDLADAPALRPIRDELDKLLPAPAPPPDASGVDKLCAQLVALTSDGDFLRHDRNAARRRQLRSELIRRAAEPGVADGLVRAVTRDAGGQLKATIDRSALGTLRRLGAHAGPALIAWLDQVDRPRSRPGDPFRVGQGHEDLIELLGDLGSAAKDAVPLLLVHAGDPRSERRLAARAALRKIAPEVAAELE